MACELQADTVVDLLQRRRLEYPPELELFELTRDCKFGAVKRLFNKDVPPDVNSTHTESRSTALHVAAERNSLACLLFLLEHAADPNLPDFVGNRPLHVAVKHRHNEAVAQLLAAKAAADVVNRWQCTPLHMAAEFNNLEAARQLLRERADVDKKNSDGYVPLEFARKFKAAAVVDLIENKESREKEQDELFKICKVRCAALACSFAVSLSHSLWHCLCLSFSLADSLFLSLSLLPSPLHAHRSLFVCLSAIWRFY